MTLRNRSEPTFYVKLVTEGREPMRVDLSLRVFSFSYEDTAKRADKLTLTIDNWDLSNFDDPIWKEGNILEVAWGYPGDMGPARQVVIQKVTGFQLMTVEAHGRAVLMNKKEQFRTFKNVRRSDVVRQIATENHYNIADIQETKDVLETITQPGETDLQFIVRLAHEEGFRFFVDHLGLHFHEDRYHQRPIRSLRWYTEPQVGEIISIQIENDITARPGKIVFSSKDPRKKKKDFGVGRNRSGRLGLAPIVGVPGPDDVRPNRSSSPAPVLGPTGENIVQGIGESDTPQVGADTDGETLVLDPESGDERWVANKNNVAESTHPSPHPAGPNQRLADGAYKKAQTVVLLSATIIGDPNVFAKCNIEFLGISQRLSGIYHVEQATHKIQGSGYTLELKCIRDGTSEAGGLPSNAKLPDKKQGAADPNAQTSVLRVNPDTGEEETGFRDSRGEFIKDPEGT